MNFMKFFEMDFQVNPTYQVIMSASFIASLFCFLYTSMSASQLLFILLYIYYIVFKSSRSPKKCIFFQEKLQLVDNIRNKFSIK